MTTSVQKNETSSPTLSEKALRLLAAHDREAQGFDKLISPVRRANRWG